MFPSANFKAILKLVLMQKRAALVSTPSSLCHIDFQGAVKGPPPKNKRQRRMRGPDPHEEKGQNLRVITLQQICLGCFFTSKTSAILLEKDWLSVQQTFTAPVYRHRFGT